MSNRIDNLRGAIEIMHKCKAAHAGSDVIEERYDNKIVWNGVVESFYLSGHPKAHKCYAWSYKSGNNTEYVTVLEIPPVTSPKMAVQAAIASGQMK